MIYFRLVASGAFLFAGIVGLATAAVREARRSSPYPLSVAAPARSERAARARSAGCRAAAACRAGARATRRAPPQRAKPVHPAARAAARRRGGRGRCCCGRHGGGGIPTGGASGSTAGGWYRRRYEPPACPAAAPTGGNNVACPEPALTCSYVGERCTCQVRGNNPLAAMHCRAGWHAMPCKRCSAASCRHACPCQRSATPVVAADLAGAYVPRHTSRSALVLDTPRCCRQWEPPRGKRRVRRRHAGTSRPGASARSASWNAPPARAAAAAAPAPPPVVELPPVRCTGGAPRLARCGRWPAEMLLEARATGRRRSTARRPRARRPLRPRRRCHRKRVG